jgi:hypothetical protein
VTVPVPNPFVIGPGNSSWQAPGDGGCGERETAKKRKEEELAAEGERRIYRRRRLPRRGSGKVSRLRVDIIVAAVDELLCRASEVDFEVRVRLRVSRVSTLVTWKVIMAVCSFVALHFRDLGMAER